MRPAPSRRAVLGGVAAAALAGPARAQPAPRVRFMMDWAWQAGQAFALAALYKGYFREANVDIVLERGFGSGRVPVELATGAYQMGFADFGTLVRFRNERPETGIVIVAILYHGGPHAVIVRASSGIRAPKDLEGKTLAAPEVDASRQLFPAFCRANGVDLSKVTFQTVAGELREPMLAQRRADGITGFLNTSQPALVRLGVPVAEQFALRYRDHGLPLFASCIATTRRFAEAQPEAVRGVVRAMTRGLKDTIADPEATMAILARHEPLTDVPLERGRWDVTLAEMVDTPEVRAGGIAADPARLDRAIELVETGFGLPRRLSRADVYTADFLPEPAVQRVFG
jgi:NitT/TauT family transport system substrate-binding protein